MNLIERLKALRDSLEHTTYTVWKDGIDVAECRPWCPHCRLDALIREAEAEPLTRCDERGLAETVERIKEMQDLGPELCQLLDGWHADGTAWSEWDESIRQRLSKLLLSLEIYHGR